MGEGGQRRGEGGQRRGRGWAEEGGRVGRGGGAYTTISNNLFQGCGCCAV